eukprot:Hpha_TRINITY_DN15834_c0_g16::TRINITY_DN15834_c0_g16_i1::g.190514::m.190514
MIRLVLPLLLLLLQWQPSAATPAWPVMPGTNLTWSVVTSACGTAGNFSPVNVVRASDKFGLFTPGVECGSIAGVAADVSEWGYDFQEFTSQAQPQVPCDNLTMKSYTTDPASRHEALERMGAYFECRTRAASPPSSSPLPAFDLIGHYFYAGLGAQLAPVAAVGTEIGENINSVNAHLAFTRGSGRQLSVPFAVDFSAWMQGYITDYSVTRPWGHASSAGGDGGHSLSLFKRSYYAAYSAGATQLIAEAGSVNWFLEDFTPDGVLRLSPLGEIGRDFSNFSRQDAAGGERAVPHAPVALVMEPAHGFGLAWCYQGKAWAKFKLTPGEELAWAVMKELWPGSWLVENEFHTQKSESNYMVASPFADVFDVIQASGSQLADTGLLQSWYRAAWLLGDVAVDDEAAANLTKFVRAGGTVVVTASQLQSMSSQARADLVGAQLAGSASVAGIKGARDAQTGWNSSLTWGKTASVYAVSEVSPSCVSLVSLVLQQGGTVPAVLDNSVGAGHVRTMLLEEAVTLSSLGLVSHLAHRLVDDDVYISPFTLTDPSNGADARARVQMMLGKRPSRVGVSESVASWDITLVNNRGVVKQPSEAAVVDLSQAVNVSIASAVNASGPILRAWHLSPPASGKSLPVVGGKVTVEVQAGDVVVVGVEVQQL